MNTIIQPTSKDAAWIETALAVGLLILGAPFFGLAALMGPRRTVRHVHVHRHVRR